MILKDLTDPKAVRQAMTEYDQLGQEAFLAKYGYRKANKFFLIHAGKKYDSKAICGVAHGYQFGTPLRSNEFSGGAATVQKKLEQLGFKLSNGTGGK